MGSLCVPRADIVSFCRDYLNFNKQTYDAGQVFLLKIHCDLVNNDI